MGSHTDCKNWEYEKHPKRARITARCDRLTELIKKRPRRFDRYSYNTRPGHTFIFSGLGPPDCPCIIGDYRGSTACKHLATYQVRVSSDHRVGLDYSLVAVAMVVFEGRAKSICDAYAAWANHAGAKISPEAALVKFVVLLSDLLEQFLRIHPYANGNGHAARLLLWVLMTRHGFTPARWPLDASPPYGGALSAFRDGDPRPLQQFLLAAIRP